MASAASEGLSAVHLVQAFSLESRMLGTFAGLIGESTSQQRGAVRLQARFGPLVEVAGALLHRGGALVRRERVLNGHAERRRAAGLHQLPRLSLYKPVKALTKLSTALSQGRRRAGADAARCWRRTRGRHRPTRPAGRRR